MRTGVKTASVLSEVPGSQGHVIPAVNASAEMTTVAEKKKHEAERKGEAEHKARMNELEKERIRVIKHNQDMEQQCNRLEKETAEAKKNKEELQRKIKETEDAKNILLPRVKCVPVFFFDVLLFIHSCLCFV